MKFLLIQPPEERTLRSNLPTTIESLRGKNPPIGLLYAAAAARTVPGWEVELLDAAAEGLAQGDIAREVAARRPDLVGITATTFTYLDVLAAARAAKAGHAACRVILGGVQPFLFPRETLAQPDVDFILSGEAEESLPRALTIWADEGPDAVGGGRVPGVLARGDDALGFAPAPMIADLDAIPRPAWELSPVARYASLVTPLRPVTILITSRGCPYRCRYCALSVTGKRWRAHGPRRVVEEMQACRGLGARYLLLYDEVFTARKDRVLAICDLLGRDGWRTPWMARGTTDTVDAETLRAMRAAGCELVTFGVESGSPRVLERLGRRASIAEMVAAFDAARAAGLSTIAYFMVGSPGESREDVEASLRLARRIRPDMIHGAIFVPYPGSAFYEEGRKTGLIPGDHWREFSLRPRDDFRPPYWNETFTDDELEALLRRFYRRFFVRPGYVLRRLARLRGLADLAAAARGLWALLRFPGAP